MEAAPQPDGAREPAPATNALPTVESPPLAPGAETPATATDTPAPASEPIVAEAPATEPIAAPRPRFVLRARHRRYAVLAVAVTLAAALGAVVGALASVEFSARARPNAAVVEENQAMQQSIARLGKEIATLKASLEQANSSTLPQTAKVSERLAHAAGEITGAISAPRTTAPVLAGWTIRDSRNGYVYAESHGELYRVVLGAPLPGLGPVQSVKRRDVRWMVVTPRGVIVSIRQRRYFEDF